MSWRAVAPVETFEFDDPLPGGIVAYEVGAICPNECALHAAAQRALACADGVVRWPDDGPLRFVADELMDDPERTKERCARRTVVYAISTSIRSSSRTAIRSSTARKMTYGRSLARA
jgi:hypothetical protein